ncbi:MAG: cytochrome c oxidase assembly protein, partial [Acidiferrobacterales bacterium]
MIAFHSHPLDEPLNQLAGLMILSAGALYAYAFYDLYRHGSFGSLWRRGLIRGYHVFLFTSGLVVLAVALLSPLDQRAEVRFSAHMAQHILLTMVAPPLLLFGLPSPIARAAFSRRWLRRLAEWLTDPLIVFALFFLNL